MMSTEEKRYQIQLNLDKSKSQEQRNLLGQFSTPYPLGRDIVEYALSLLGRNVHLSLLEPACGTGVFFSALQDATGTDRLEGSLGFEIDPHYFGPASELWMDKGVEIRCEDFLSAEPSALFPLLIANPPYSRHHHLPSERKRRLQEAVLKQTGEKMSGLSGLYCYFMLLSTRWLQEGGLSCWLVPSEFMDVNYGEPVKDYLLNKVDLVRIHRFDEKDLQFSDALVSSSVVVFRHARPSGQPVVFSTGGSICHPSTELQIDRCRVNSRQKWTHLFADVPTGGQAEGSQSVLGDYFEVKRGIATGSNRFFLVNEKTIARYGLPKEYLTPILPAPRQMKTDVIRSENGIPVMDERLFLFSTDDSREAIMRKYPNVLDYIAKGEADGVNNTYICSRHTPWYSCEKRRSAPFVVPYMGRGENGHKMFRFILNKSDAIATNGYLLMYPKPQYAYLFHNPQLVESVWELLNTISATDFDRHGRVYGGGLHKLEPRELLSIPISGLDNILGQNLFHIS